ncbi:MAG: histidine kinase dimerization/phosphoacceptor domain -containing protein [bacterium]
MRDADSNPIQELIMEEKPKILIVDDKPENIFALRESLKDIEAEFIEAASGNEALKQILNHDFALALIDVQMPIMDGYELAEIMRGDEKARHIPIIFISAIYSDDYHLFKGYDSGAVDFITKPYEPSIFLSKCKIFINLYTQKREIEKSRDYIHNILASMHDALMVTNPQGVIEKVNKATTKLLGYDQGELIGKSIGLIVEKAEDVFYKEERTLLAKSGRRIPVLFSRSLMRNEAGGMKGMVFVATDISDRKQAEEKIKASLEEKELLLRELYHRTKNNMQVIVSLIMLQSNYIKDERVLQTFREIENRIKSMALVHKNLYQSKSLSKIDLKQYVEELAQNLLKSYNTPSGQISLKFSAGKSIFISIDTAVPCGLVINEILSNSLQHAFPGDRKGEITMSLHTTDTNEIEIRIADNGIGVPQDFDFRKTNSLGFELIISLIEKQLNGEVKINTDQGMEIRFRFKELYNRQRITYPH